MSDSIARIVLTAVDQASGTLGKVSQSLEGFGKSAERIGGNLEKLGLRVGGLGLAVDRGMARMGLDVQTIASNSIAAEASLYSLANTAGIAGDKAVTAVGDWSVAIRDISVQTNKSQADIVLAMQDLVSKGMDPQKALAMLVPIGRAATATGADIKDMAASANAVAQNLNISNIGQALDMMAKAGNAGAFELRDMAQYFDLLTVKSSLLGQKGPGALASLASAAQIARKGAGDASTAANNLANFLDKLTAPVTAKAFEKFGLNLAEETKKGLASGDLIGYMGNLVQKTTGGDPAKLSRMFTDVQARNFIAPLIQNLDEYKRIRDEALSASGVVDTQFDTALQSTSAKLDTFKNSVTAAMQNSTALQTILDSLNGIAKWATEHADLAAYIGLGAAGAVVIGGGIVAAGAVVTAIGTISTALAGLSAFLAANPVVLAILGIVGAGVAGYKFGEWIGLGEVGKKLGSAMYDVVQAIKKGYEAVKATLAAWKQIGIDIVMGLWEGIKATVRKPIEALGKLAADMPDWTKKLLGIRSPSTVFAEIGQNIGEGLIVGIESTLPDVQSAADGLVEVLSVSSTKRPRNADGSFKSQADAKAQGTGLLGGVREYTDSIKTMADAAKDTVVRAFKGMEDALVNFATTGKLDFKALADSIISDLIRIQVQKSIMEPLSNSMKGVDWGSMFSSFAASAKGNVFSGAGISAYSNQIVDRPTFFAAGGNVMGEAGPEAIIPLKRASNGDLGIKGGVGGNVQVNVINNASGTKATASERNEGGTKIIDVIVDAVEGRVAGNITRGAGPVTAALTSTFGLNRQAGMY